MTAPLDIAALRAKEARYREACERLRGQTHFDVNDVNQRNAAALSIAANARDVLSALDEAAGLLERAKPEYAFSTKPAVIWKEKRDALLQRLGRGGEPS